MVIVAVDRVREEKEHANGLSDASNLRTAVPESSESTKENLIPPESHEPEARYPTATAPFVDRFIDEPRSLKVAVIGGGLAGILSGILLPKKVPNIELTIYEKNSDFVGHHAIFFICFR